MSVPSTPAFHQPTSLRPSFQAPPAFAVKWSVGQVGEDGVVALEHGPFDSLGYALETVGTDDNSRIVRHDAPDQPAVPAYRWDSGENRMGWVLLEG